MITATHRVTNLTNGKVRIHDLELFVGYDNTIDDPGNARIRKFTRARVIEVVEKTNKYIRRGQSPKLILGHNPKDPDKADGWGARPTIGDIPSIRMVRINGVPGIVGDVVMSMSDFKKYVQSNAFPRRSAEIWPDGFLSEVALLGATTPARPLPDTRFHQLAAEHGGEEVDFFERACTPGKYEASMSDPGPYNVNPPRGGSKRRRRSMASDDDDKDTKDTEDHDDDQDENAKLKAQLMAAEDERDAMKARLAKFETDEDQADKSARSTELERDDFERQVERQGVSIAKLERELRAEKYGRKIDEARAEGYKVGDRKSQGTLLERVIRAEDPDGELRFLKELMGKDATDLVIDQRGAVAAGGSRQGQEKMQKAADQARDECLAASETQPQQFKARYDKILANN